VELRTAAVSNILKGVEEEEFATWLHCALNGLVRNEKL
jgi:hypothetical protein